VSLNGRGSAPSGQVLLRPGGKAQWSVRMLRNLANAREQVEKGGASACCPKPNERKRKRRWDRGRRVRTFGGDVGDLQLNRAHAVASGSGGRDGGSGGRMGGGEVISKEGKSTYREGRGGTMRARWTVSQINTEAGLRAKKKGERREGG